MKFSFTHALAVTAIVAGITAPAYAQQTTQKPAPRVPACLYEFQGMKNACGASSLRSPACQEAHKRASQCVIANNASGSHPELRPVNHATQGQPQAPKTPPAPAAQTPASQ